MSRRLAITAVLSLALAACGGAPTKPDAAPAAAPSPAPAPATAPAPAPTPDEAPKKEGERIEGVKLTPGVVDIAKKEGEVKLTKDDRVKCEKYKPIGSNRTQYRCTTLAEKRKSEEDNQREMRKIETPPPSARGTLDR